MTHHFDSPLSNTKMDVSKLSISCLVKRYRLVCRNVESRGDERAQRVWEIPLSRDFKSGDNGDCMLLNFYSGSQSSQRQRRTSHFFRSGDSVLPLLLAFSPLRLLIGFISSGENFGKLSKVDQTSLTSDLRTRGTA